MRASAWTERFADAEEALSSFLLRHLRLVDVDGDRACDLRLQGGRVTDVERGLHPRRRERVFDASDHMALPGLINAHDHLELNLLPRLGQPPYENAYQWAEEIYRPDTPPIDAHLRVTLRDRLWWSAYKNLVSGVTTVVHHGTYHRSVFSPWFGRRFPIRVLERYAWCHSLGLGDPGAADSPRSRRAGTPFILHAAEGTDARSREEVDQLDRLGLLAPHTVLGHGIALTSSQRRRVAESGAGVVWCPSSNLWLYGATAPVDLLPEGVLLGLGTDSTLSGEPTLLAELRVADGTRLVSADRLLRLVTTEAAELFGFTDGRGTLRRGAPADLLLLPERGGSPAEQLLKAAPADLQLVLVAGRPRLATAPAAEAVGLDPPNARIAGSPVWMTGDPAALRERIAAASGAELVRDHPLWELIQGP